MLGRESMMKLSLMVNLFGWLQGISSRGGTESIDEDIQSVNQVACCWDLYVLDH